MNFKPTKTKIIISLIPLVIYLLFFIGMKIHAPESFLLLTSIIYSVCAVLAKPVLNIFGNIFTDSSPWGWDLNEAGLFATWIVSGIIIYIIISIFFDKKSKVWIFGGLVGLFVFYILKSMHIGYPPIFLIAVGAAIGYAIDTIKKAKQ
jgi:hypothetical protein